MQASNFLGQIIPITTYQGLTQNQSLAISEVCKNPKIQVLVASANALKIEAARKAVTIWAQTHINNPTVEVKGFDVSSEIDEQPHGYEYTLEGAKNRLSNLKKHDSAPANVLRVLVSMENGLFKEQVKNLHNSEIFKNNDNTVWIDRCVVVAQIIFNQQKWDSQSVSVGVTTPKDCVELAEKEKWQKTAGSFIAEKYKWNAKDWHGSIAGKGRQFIMEEAILSAFGLQL